MYIYIQESALSVSYSYENENDVRNGNNVSNVVRRSRVDGVRYLSVKLILLMIAESSMYTCALPIILSDQKV
jgi:hypothetical protein